MQQRREIVFLVSELDARRILKSTRHPAISFCSYRVILSKLAGIAAVI